MRVNTQEWISRVTTEFKFYKNQLFIQKGNYTRNVKNKNKLELLFINLNFLKRFLYLDNGQYKDTRVKNNTERKSGIWPRNLFWTKLFKTTVTWSIFVALFSFWSQDISLIELSNVMDYDKQELSTIIVYTIELHLGMTIFLMSIWS